MADIAKYIDRKAVEAAERRADTQRPAAVAATKFNGRLAFKRLGYRTQANYANEELGVSARTLRRMGCLGRRLTQLPAIEQAFAAGELPLTKAEAIARVATPETEEQWLDLASALSVRELVKAVRQHDPPTPYEARGEHDQPSGPHADAAEHDVEPHDIDTPNDDRTLLDVDAPNDDPTLLDVDACNDDRTRLDVDAPGWMIGKANAILRLVAKVAGTHPPEGARWEFIAAEFLSSVGYPDGGELPMPGEEPAEVGSTYRDGSEPSPDGGSAPSTKAGAATSTFSPANTEIGAATSALSPTTCEIGAATSLHHEPAPSTGRGPSAAPDHEPAPSTGRGPVAAPDLVPTPAPGPGPAPSPTLGSVLSAEPESALDPWELHKVLKAAYRPGGSDSLELAGVLREIRNRHLWRAIPKDAHGAQFRSFGDYVGERLGMSLRTAQRLIRAEAAAWRQPALRAACRGGALSPLKVSVLIGALDLGLNGTAAAGWVEYARRMPVRRLIDAVDWARSRAAVDPSWVSNDGAAPDPTFRFDGGYTDAFATTLAASEASPATTRLRIWLEPGERQTLGAAICAIRKLRGTKWPLWACLNDLFDHFVDTYDNQGYRSLSKQSPVLKRDNWHCQAPGCTARSSLHVHHIAPRGVGGPNTFDNLIVLCDFHHLAIHRGWIGCWGKAPNRIRWQLGVNEGGGPHNGRWVGVPEDFSYRVPIARFVGHYRLDDNERFLKTEVEIFGSVTRLTRRASAG